MRWSAKLHLLGKTVTIVRRLEMEAGEFIEPGSNRQVTEAVVNTWLRETARVVNDMARLVRSSRNPSLSRRISEAFQNEELVVLAVPRAGSSADSGPSAGQQPAKPPKPPTPPAIQEQPPPSKPKKTWYKAQLFDEDGEPMAGEYYELKSNDGVLRKGRLDQHGCVYVPEILEAGDGNVITFPEMHLNPVKKKKK